MKHDAPLTVSLGSFLGVAAFISEKKRQEFREKNRIKFVDKKWFNSLSVIGSPK